MADLPLIQDYTLMMEKLARALRVYAREDNWGKDDWGVPSVIQSEYGKPGTRARETLKKYERWKAGASSTSEEKDVT